MISAFEDTDTGALLELGEVNTALVRSALFNARDQQKNARLEVGDSPSGFIANPEQVKNMMRNTQDRYESMLEFMTD